MKSTELKNTIYKMKNFISCTIHKKRFSSGQSLSCVRLFVTPWTAARQASLSITKPSEHTQTHVYHTGDAIQPSHPLLSPFPALNLSQHQGLFK